MSKVIVTEQYLEDIADAIREKTGSALTYTPSEMAEAILTISGGGGIVPTGTINITTNGTHNVYNYASANVNVPTGSTINNQDKTVSPTTSQQSITYDSSYTGLGTVTVNAIQTETKTVTVNGDVLPSSGKFLSKVTVNVPTGSTINNQDKSVSPTESAQTVTADSGYTGLGTVTVGAISSTYIGSDIDVDPTPTVDGATVTIPTGYYSNNTTKFVASGSAATPATTITANPTISVNTSTGVITATASATKSLAPNVTAGYVSSGTAGTITVNGSNTSTLTTVNGTTITPTETEQTAVAANRYTLGAVKVGAISSTYVGSEITRRDSDDLTVSGATISVPSGYYASNASKSVTTMTLPTSAASSATSGYTSKATIGRSTSAQYINIPPGYNSAGGYYTISATPNGSVTAPSTISGTSATISTGTNTLTLTKTVSVTPSVTTAGYISAGTAGNSSVSLTASVTTKAAATITPGTSDQTIASGTYLTGTQTIAGDADLVASNIVNGVSIFGVTGNVVLQNYYTGTSAPSASLGQNGDIYIQQ